MRPGIAPVVSTADYCIGLEDVGGMRFLHGAVFVQFTVSVARRMRADADAVVARYGPPIFGIAVEPKDGDHLKLDRFMRLMGFHYHSIERINGIARVCYVRWR